MCGRIAWIGSDDAVEELEDGPLAPVTAKSTVLAPVTAKSTVLATDRLHFVSDHSAVPLGRPVDTPRNLDTSVTAK